MTLEQQLHEAAGAALSALREAGFDQALATATATEQTELNVAHNEPSLMRSTDARKLSLTGIVDGRTASTELADFSPAAVRERAQQLLADARSAPSDEANAVSSGQAGRIVQGPQEADVDTLAQTMAELLAFRASQTPRFLVDEANAQHARTAWHTLTSSGSDISGSVGCYAMVVMGTAKDGNRSSSFNYTGGTTNDLRAASAQAHFGIDAMMRETERQIDTQPLGDKFTGDVVFTPGAVGDLLGWLLAQISDMQLIAGTSLFRDRVGQAIASPLLSVRSRFDGPGLAAVSSDAFLAPPVELLAQGRLLTLTPSLYGSRKTGLPHRPVAAQGWEMAAGDTPLDEIVRSVPRGALVGRLSMGSPATNGDFSGVIKNSFRIDDGAIGPALAETMITGNMARMLLDVAAVSRERLDTGSACLPWLRVSGLHFS